MSALKERGEANYWQRTNSISRESGREVKRIVSLTIGANNAQEMGITEEEGSAAAPNAP